MTGILIASSPIEIEAELDAAGGSERYSRGFHDHALSMFHQLTSELELGSLDLRTTHQTEWPAHRFYFGPSSSGIEHILSALQGLDGAIRIPAASHSTTSLPSILFSNEASGDFAGILVACPDAAALDRTAANIERRA